MTGNLFCRKRAEEKAKGPSTDRQGKKKKDIVSKVGLDRSRIKKKKGNSDKRKALRCKQEVQRNKRLECGN